VNYKRTADNTPYTWIEKIHSEVPYLEISGSWAKCTSLLVISNQSLLSHCIRQHDDISFSSAVCCWCFLYYCHYY